jgi:hypothetical protein
MYTIIQQNCAGNKQKSYKIMRKNTFAAKDKAKSDRKYKRLKLGGGSSSSDRSSDSAAVVA